jgi:acetolactate synthase-1/2/3 large subunit
MCKPMNAERPVVLLGNGARGASLAPLLAAGYPILTSWQSKDLLDNNHPMYFGSPGQYGQRIANRILFEADHILSIGCRMAIWQVGYEGPRPDQTVTMVDVDAHEVDKFPHAVWINEDAGKYISTMEPVSRPDWLAKCNAWRMEYPLVESPAHDDKDGYINSYRFMQALQEQLRGDEVIVTDMGTAHICAHQVLKLTPPQSILSSGGLGEMGCGLPMAIGAAFARGKEQDVLCLVGDGGMMMNLQELQTIWQHQLRIKIIVFSNDGYGMIRETQKKAGKPYIGVNAATGVTCPSFRTIAQSMGFPACDLRTWDDFNRAIPQLLYARGPALVEYHMNPEQPMVPKLDPVYVDGKATSPRFCDMSPMI